MSPRTAEDRRAYYREYIQRPEVKERRRAAQARFRARNRARLAEKQRAYFQANRERCLAKQREYRRRPEVKERRRAYCRGYHQKNREARRQYKREWYRRKVRDDPTFRRKLNLERSRHNRAKRQQWEHYERTGEVLAVKTIVEQLKEAEK